MGSSSRSLPSAIGFLILYDLVQRIEARRRECAVTLDPRRLLAARAANNDHPPATIRFDGKDVPNPTKNDPPSSYLGLAQKKWFLERLTQSNAP